MKFLVDAQLPQRLTTLLISNEHDAVHTSDLPAGNRTSDKEIARMVDSEKLILITKDSDFVDSFLLHGSPCQLLWVTTGNINNDALLALFKHVLTQLSEAFSQANYVELTSTDLVVHQ